MSDPYFQTLFADRIGGASYGKATAIYKFEKIKRAKRKALADHPERQLLDFGIGENDEMADELVRERWPRRSTSPRTAATPTTARRRSRRPSRGSCSASTASRSIRRRR